VKTLARWTETRTKADRFCKIVVELHDTDKGPELSVCGEEGRIMKRTEAKRDALAYWEGFFEEDVAEMARFRRQHHKLTAKSAARHVLACDGELVGIDVVPSTPETKPGLVFVLESCGQIREELAAWFPEYAEHVAHHLNGMHAECEHQAARGETYASLTKAPPRTRKGENAWGAIVDVDVPATECPDCAYSCGSAWRYRPLTPATLAWAQQAPAAVKESALWTPSRRSSTSRRTPSRSCVRRGSLSSSRLRGRLRVYPVP